MLPIEKELEDSNICGLPCEIYSRVTGYHRPLKNWNTGKQEEFRQRKYFNMGRAAKQFDKYRFKVSFDNGEPQVEKL